MKAVIKILFTIAFCGAIFAADDIARTGRDAYSARRVSANAARQQYNMTATQYQSTASSYQGTYNQSLANSGAQNYSPAGIGVDGRPYSYNPITSYMSYKTYAVSPTGMQYSYPIYGTKLPNRITDRNTIRTGMPEYDSYLQNKILANTVYGSDSLASEMELKNSEYAGHGNDSEYSLSAEFRESSQDLITKQYIKELIAREQGSDTKDPLLNKVSASSTANEADRSGIDDKDSYKDKQKDVYELMRDELGTYDLDKHFAAQKEKDEEAALAAKEETQRKEDMREKLLDDPAGEKSEVDKRIEESVKLVVPEGEKLSNEAKSILGKHTTFASLSKDKFNMYMKQAEEYMASGEYYKAVNAYSTAKIYKKYDPLVHLGTCLAQLAAGEYLSSSVSLNNAMIIYPDIVKIHIDLPALIGNRDIVEDRMVDMQRWIERNGSSELIFLLSYVYYQMDNPEMARDELIKARGTFSPRLEKSASLLAEQVGADFSASEMIEQELVE
ncbi:MAG: hypothetical protein AB7F23_03755 [Phycisphaerae bacterium]